MGQFAKYKTRLTKSEKQKSKEELGLQVEKAEMQFQADILATREALLDAKQELESMLCTYPLNVQGILDTESEIKGFENAIERMQELKAKLF